METNARPAATTGHRYLILAVAGLILIVGQGIWIFHDSLLLAAVVLATGVVWLHRGWRAWGTALAIASAGFTWSLIDPDQCSVGFRGRVVYEKLVGHLPYVPWSQVGHHTFARCASFFRGEAELAKQIRLVSQRVVKGKELEQYETPLGSFWIPPPGQELLAWLTWEISVQHDYESGQVAIRPGDTVIDGGAHVGVFTRYALHRGAGRVIAIEPEAANILSLEANLAAEIADGRVRLVKAGIWDKRGDQALSESSVNSARHSFVRTVADTEAPTIPLVTIDAIVAELQLDRVDFIKMDIEGAERRALEGARGTLTRVRPKLAICTYHILDDTEAIPAVVRRIQPSYRISAKDFAPGSWRLTTKVVFFQ
jgi:FkbM family methyltransferase